MVDNVKKLNKKLHNEQIEYLSLNIDKFITASSIIFWKMTIGNSDTEKWLKLKIERIELHNLIFNELDIGLPLNL